MKVLVISHTVFSKTESMGKTLKEYFSEFSSENLAQFFIHNQTPTEACCQDYYRITDKEVILSIWGRKAGKSYHIANGSLGCNSDTDQSLITQRIYQKARKRTPLVYIARNVWWRIGHWNNKNLRCWLDSVGPDCVFFASGDYAFMYDIAWKIARSRNIPLFVSCMDDYYIYNKNENSVFGRLHHRFFMKSVKRAIGYSNCIFCICEKMSADYKSLFGKDTITIHTPSSLTEPLHEEKKDKISYLGNLGYQRDKQLIAIGKALKELNLSIKHIDVYSTESRKEVLDGLTLDNGIVFHGAIEADEVRKVIGESLAIIHTESFDQEIRQSIRYSVSTKIADSLMSGTCIFAYGPDDVASIDYLQKNNAAVCCTDTGNLTEIIRQIICDVDLRDKVQKNAIRLAKQNHLKSKSIIYDSIW